MPVIIIKTVAGATAEQKKLVMQKFTDIMKEVLGKNPETTHIIFEEFSSDDWGLRGKSVTDIRAGR